MRTDKSDLGNILVVRKAFVFLMRCRLAVVMENRVFFSQLPCHDPLYLHSDKKGSSNSPPAVELSIELLQRELYILAFANMLDRHSSINLFVLIQESQ